MKQIAVLAGRRAPSSLPDPPSSPLGLLYSLLQGRRGPERVEKRMGDAFEFPKPASCVYTKDSVEEVKPPSCRPYRLPRPPDERGDAGRVRGQWGPPPGHWRISGRPNKHKIKL